MSWKPIFLNEVVCCTLDAEIYLWYLYRPWSISFFDNAVSLASGPILRFLILFQQRYYNTKYYNIFDGKVSSIKYYNIFVGISWYFSNKGILILNTCSTQLFSTASFFWIRIKCFVSWLSTQLLWEDRYYFIWQNVFQ